MKKLYFATQQWRHNRQTAEIKRDVPEFFQKRRRNRQRKLRYAKQKNSDENISRCIFESCSFLINTHEINSDLLLDFFNSFAAIQDFHWHKIYGRFKFKLIYETMFNIIYIVFTVLIHWSKFIKRFINIRRVFKSNLFLFTLAFGSVTKFVLGLKFQVIAA